MTIYIHSLHLEFYLDECFFPYVPAYCSCEVEAPICDLAIFFCFVDRILSDLKIEQSCIIV